MILLGFLEIDLKHQSPLGRTTCVSDLINQTPDEKEDENNDNQMNMNIDSDEEKEEVIVITDKAFRNSSPEPTTHDKNKEQQQPQIQNKTQDKMQSKHNNNKGENWRVIPNKLPLPTLALIDSIENYDDSIYPVSNYINTFSNRPYAYYRNERFNCRLPTCRLRLQERLDMYLIQGVWLGRLLVWVLCSNSTMLN